MQPVFEAVEVFNTRLRAVGAWVFAGGLRHIDATTTVDATGGGEPVLADGPYAESEEWMGGFWAAEGSAACRGKVQVRPFQEG